MNRILVINGKKLMICIIMSIVAISTCLMGNSLVSKVIETSAKGRKIPIYSVETNKKIVALTFDCAWRGRRY